MSVHNAAVLALHIQQYNKKVALADEEERLLVKSFSSCPL